MLKLILSFAVLFLIGLQATAANKSFEYKAVDYDARTTFLPQLESLGNDGWELASCITSGSQSANWSTSEAQMSNGYFINSFDIEGSVARTSYCIFKRVKTSK